MTEPRKQEVKPDALTPEPVSPGLLLLSDRVRTLEEALAGLLHTVTDQQASLARVQKQTQDLARTCMDLDTRLRALEGSLHGSADGGRVPLVVSPQVAAACEAFLVAYAGDGRFQHDMELAVRRQDKVRNGPLMQLHKAIVGADGDSA